ncbi:High-affinity zinc uptake system membrane protein ZnuB [Oligella sp. MSHR50489EDL]|uniref:metal ABC transporter permease n=1 Tax=Oligella sp. MSHR50489EDL TaxID=3139409 RepID=UPI003D8181C7
MFATIREFIIQLAQAGFLPSDFSYQFVVNSLLAGLILGPLLGGFGTLVVIKKLAFFSEATGHAALTGVALGILLNEPIENPYGGLFAYCLIFALFLNYIKNRSALATDTLIGVFLSVSLALGASVLLVLATKINVHILENVLFGTLLTVNDHDLYLLLGVAVITVPLLTYYYNELLVSSFNQQFAKVRKVPVLCLDYLFILLITFCTIASIKIIGAILVGALLVIPAAAARLVAQSMRQFFYLSVLISTSATLLGVYLPIRFDVPVPSGGAIILIAGGFFLILLLIKQFVRIR